MRRPGLHGDWIRIRSRHGSRNRKCEASLCNQAVPNRQHSKLRLSVPFPRECVQYRCVECSRSVDVAHNFGERTPQEHRTGDGSYVPCSGTLLLYAMPKLLHDATSFDLLLPSVELDKATGPVCRRGLLRAHR